MEGSHSAPDRLKVRMTHLGVVARYRNAIRTRGVRSQDCCFEIPRIRLGGKSLLEHVYADTCQDLCSRQRHGTYIRDTLFDVFRRQSILFEFFKRWKT